MGLMNFQRSQDRNNYNYNTTIHYSNLQHQASNGGKALPSNTVENMLKTVESSILASNPHLGISDARQHRGGRIASPSQVLHRMHRSLRFLAYLCIFTSFKGACVSVSVLCGFAGCAVPLAQNNGDDVRWTRLQKSRAPCH